MLKSNCALAAPSALLVLAVAAFAAVRIGGSSFSANGQMARDHQYIGACPVDLKFDWGVISMDSSDILYSTTRSDGARSAPHSLYHPGNRRSIPLVEHWRLGANTPQFRNYTGWMELHIESPNAAAARIGFTLHCR